VTSYGRVRLWNAIHVAGQGHVYACDTDSVITDEQGQYHLEEEGMISDIDLGLLKVEETSTDPNDEVLAAKVYRFNGKQTWKGHKGEDKKVFDREKDGTLKEKFLQQQWPSLNGLLAAGNGLGEFYNTIRLRDDIPKNLKSKVRPDGWCIPFTWDELPKLSPSQRRDLRLPPVTEEDKKLEKVQKQEIPASG
jgi:hypothetical protein